MGQICLNVLLSPPQGMPLWLSPAALLALLHLLPAAAIPIYQEQPIILQVPAFQDVKDPDDGGPSIERVPLLGSSFSDRDEKSGGEDEQPMEYFENVPRRKLSGLLVSRLRDAWAQVNSLLFCSRLPMCAARLHMFNVEGMRANHQLTTSLLSARSKITNILKRIQGSKGQKPANRANL